MQVAQILVGRSHINTFLHWTYTEILHSPSSPSFFTLRFKSAVNAASLLRYFVIFFLTLCDIDLFKFSTGCSFLAGRLIYFCLFVFSDKNRFSHTAQLLIQINSEVRLSIINKFLQQMLTVLATTELCCFLSWTYEIYFLSYL